MALEGIVNKRGTLDKMYLSFNPDTIQHSAEIMNDRRTDNDLRSKWFWTADSALCRVEDGEPVLYFGGRETNLIFRDIEEAVGQLRKTGDYVPGQGSVQEVVGSVESGNTLRIRLSDLQLTKHTNEFSYFEVCAGDYKRLNGFQREFAERVYGKGKDFDRNMAMLSGEGITKTRIYVLDPKYVGNNVGEDRALAGACWLGSFDGSSDFIAGGRNSLIDYSSLRGVPEGGDARKSADRLVESYKVILSDPKEAIKRMTPEIAAGVSEVLTAYLRQKE